ncbi:phospholipase C, phosphocholine-specific [Photobacterium kishitanii]|uniref:phosphocholine-specific phospholipase C n=1 Tax=Photobacterium kishitanii TaxID=318456 RepID=UPI000430A92A|nr:phospholipase C, phosphocholine-specific [Photobacterium kishitanii]OBU28862.1 phospholipase C, phosphocholine-specific [Photobacterium kishitanii]PSW71597.1 phospholipase C, phosphocholine-specific [Photobacterium kishitanii]CEO42143.1 Non-hemolytic phospholipase C [Photobacterium kishitanii]
MISNSRRSFIKTTAITAAGAATISSSSNVFASIEKALSIPANRHHGSIKDVEHVVILMQENRAFDHYFGTLPGIRGFGDRFPLKQPNGSYVWQQFNETPDPKVGNYVSELLPWYFNTSENIGYERFGGTPHFYDNAQQAYNHGKMDQWLPQKSDRTMGYFCEQELAFQFALANNFTLCDAYHCSLHTGTNPNRVMFWTGTNDAYGKRGGPVLTNANEDFHHDKNLSDKENYHYDMEDAFRWKTYPERLEDAGVSWRLFQNIDNNYTDNPLHGFKSFRKLHYKDRQHPLYQKGIGTDNRLSIEIFEDQYNSNEGLPQVSWIVCEKEYSEHPGPSCPLQGAAYTAKVLDILTSDPDVWSKTVFIITFDENDGLFDHMPPPSVPHRDPLGNQYGKSNIKTDGEYYYNTAYPGGAGKEFIHNASHGLGPRVPTYIISPWSTGGNVNSELFDHTSVLQFLEQFTGVREDNISPWRREVCGNLMSCFDFEKKDATVDIPDEVVTDIKTANAYRAEADQWNEDHGEPNIPQSNLVGLPAVDHYVRPSCDLPYSPQVDIQIKSQAVQFEYKNNGKKSIVYQTYNYVPSNNSIMIDENDIDLTMPRNYTVMRKNGNPLKPIVSDKWSVGKNTDIDLMTFGPNGFIRHIKANTSDHQELPLIEIRHKALRGHKQRPHLAVKIINPSDQDTIIVVKDNSYGNKTEKHRIKAGKTEHIELKLNKHCWYDVTITLKQQPNFSLQAAGRVEQQHRHNYQACSDPQMGNLSNTPELEALIVR